MRARAHARPHLITSLREVVDPSRRMSSKLLSGMPGAQPSVGIRVDYLPTNITVCGPCIPSFRALRLSDASLMAVAR